MVSLYVYFFRGGIVYSEAYLINKQSKSDKTSLFSHYCSILSTGKKSKFTYYSDFKKNNYLIVRFCSLTTEPEFWLP